jgi:hypothetical protein
MGKKSKQKKQRQNQQRQQKVVMRTEVVSTPMQTMTAAQTTPQTMTTNRPVGLEIGEQFIRRDIVRILILLAVVVIILVALYITNLHSTSLVQAGQKFAHFMRLQ